MSIQKQVFTIGPGFIGGEILDLLLEESRYEITELVRRQAAAENLEELGTATADDLVSVEAVIEGITQRLQSGQNAIFIHTSGATFLADDSKGSFPAGVFYEDNKPENIDAKFDEALHRKIDLAIVNANESLGPEVKLAIMIPPLIYGISSREKRLSIHLPTLARFAIKHSYAEYIGEDLSMWSYIYVRDLARGYMTLLYSLETSNLGIKNPYFFVVMERIYYRGNAL